jgi:hypothetical protein
VAVVVAVDSTQLTVMAQAEQAVPVAAEQVIHQAEAQEQAQQAQLTQVVVAVQVLTVHSLVVHTMEHLAVQVLSLLLTLIHSQH